MRSTSPSHLWLCSVNRTSWRRGAFVRLLLGLMLAGISSGCVTWSSEPRVDPADRAVSLRDIGVDHLRNGRTAMAIRKLSESRGLNPKDPVTFLTLGEAYRRKGLLDKAEELIRRSLELEPDKTDFNRQETVLNLSALYIQMQRWDEAMAHCQTLIDDPTFSTPWRALTNRGWAEYKRGDNARARASFEQALEFHDRYSPAHLNLGIVAQSEKHWLDAIRSFERALDGQRLGSDAAAQANYHMAEIYVALGNRTKAIEHFEVASESSPHGQWGSQSKSYLSLLR